MGSANHYSINSIYTTLSPTCNRNYFTTSNYFNLLYNWAIKLIFLIFLYFISYFLGGMLVLFIYVTSLASNEVFKPSILIIRVIIPLSTIGLIFLVLDPIIFIQNTLVKKRSLIKDFVYSTDMELINTIYNSTNINATIFIVFYLLLTLIVVVKITGNFFGPLRLSVN